MIFLYRTRPELFTIAELFTGSSEIDANFVARLGLNALIREVRTCHLNDLIPLMAQLLLRQWDLETLVNLEDWFIATAT